MQTSMKAILAVAALSLGVAACANQNSIFRTPSLDGGDSFITDAKQRVVTNNYAAVANGRNNPKRIVCAEPSPDVAQALSTALSGALEADAARSTNIRDAQGNEVNQNQNVSGSAAISASVTEGIAQLGERLATIQLLRDGFFRACEAYSNGAISDTMYSLVVGNIDDVMVALLTTEMAAGAFGRQLAGISTTASAAAGALAEDEAELTAINGRITATRDLITANDKAIGAQRTTVAAADKAVKDAPDDQKATKQMEFDTQNATLQGLLAERSSLDQREAKYVVERNAAEKAFAKSYASALVQPGGGITRGPSDAGVKAIAEIYKQFAQRDSIGSLVAACVASLDRAPNTNGRHSENHDGGEDATVVRPDGSVERLPNSDQYATELTHVCKHLFHPQNGSKSIIVDMFKAKLKHQQTMAKVEHLGAVSKLQTYYNQNCPAGGTQAAWCPALEEILNDT